MYKRILLAVDGSDHSIRAAEHAAALAKAMDGAIEIAYVADFSKSKDAVLHARGPFGSGDAEKAASPPG